MKILLIDIDSTIPNFALKKIEKYYLDKGDEIIWDFPMARFYADKIFVSCIFPENKHKCDEWEGIAEIGGTGYDIKKKLPPEIESVKPRINWGFTTRGCIRKCYFCFVPEKEGYIHVVGDVYDLWDGEAKFIVINDNNILALPEHFKMICSQLKKENLIVDFEQGLDHRLLTDDLAQEILSLKRKYPIRFAFDDIKQQNVVEKSIKLLKKNGLKDWNSRWYVYVSPTDDFYSVYNRMKYLWEQKQGVYVMRDRTVIKNKEFQALSCWGNMFGAFKYTFKDIICTSERMKIYKGLFDKYNID